MKMPTIWESASRPLFVRTVWLEASGRRRCLQRHFVLDYDTKHHLERLNSSVKNVQEKQADALRRSISLELNDFTESEKEVFLIGSAKVKLHEPFKFEPNKKSKVIKVHRRSAQFRRKYPIYKSCRFVSSKDLGKRPADILELYSKQDSVSKLPVNAEAADELLAERVLHWLDLAGKEDFLKNLQELKEMEVKLSKASKLRQDAIKRYSAKADSSQKMKNSKAKVCQRATTLATQTAAQRNPKSLEPVKHITIIFNREGQPIRLNRPAKNIDLCALSASPSTARRLAGTLASVRLYKSAENARCSKTSYLKTKARTESNKSLSAHRRLDTVADLTNSTLQKRLHESPMPDSCHKLHDSKQQLHIFMPTLPKKGLAKSVCSGTEDGISELSHNFSELCRI